MATASGPAQVHVDQTANADQWRSIGTFALTSDGGVTLKAISGSYTRANACRFTRR